MYQQKQNINNMSLLELMQVLDQDRIINLLPFNEDIFGLIIARIKEHVKYDKNIKQVILDNRIDILNEFEKFDLDIEDMNNLLIIIKTGNLEFLKWYHNNPITSNLLKTFKIKKKYEHTYLEIVQWLIENNGPEYTIDLMQYAAENNQLDIVKWLHENKIQKFRYISVYSIAYNNNYTEIIKYLNEIYDEIYDEIYGE